MGGGPQTHSGPLTPQQDSAFGYQPTLWVCALFIALYGLTGLLHLYQSVRYRMWWWVPTVCLCAVVEIIGWSGRLWGAINPYNFHNYLMQICCTIFAPSFVTAALFIIFVRIIINVGPQYSRLKPKYYSYILVGVDLVALIIQAIGGSKAASATTGQGANQGARIMVGGIIIQMVAITAYVLASAEYFWRVYHDRPVRDVDPALLPSPLGPSTTSSDEKLPSTTTRKGDSWNMITRNVKFMIFGLGLTTVFIYVRAIYRTIELLDGWGGPIITNQVLFDCLDGIPVVSAMLTLNVFNPGRLIPFTKKSLAGETSIA